MITRSAKGKGGGCEGLWVIGTGIHILQNKDLWLCWCCFTRTTGKGVRKRRISERRRIFGITLYEIHKPLASASAAENSSFKLFYTGSLLPHPSRILTFVPEFSTVFEPWLKL